MSNLELLDRAAAATTCNILRTGGEALVGAGAVGIIFGGIGFKALTVGSAMLLAANYGCPPMDLGATGPLPGVDGCQKMKDGDYGQLQYKEGSGGWKNLSAGDSGRLATEILGTDVVEEVPGRGWASLVRFNYKNGSESKNWTTAWFSEEQDARAVTYRILPTVGECDRDSDMLPPLPPEMTNPVPYLDPVTNCNFILTLQGFAERVPGGPISPVYLMQQAGEERNDGGRMGGCNWPDTIFMPSDGGGGSDGPNGPVYLPVPDGPTPPDGPGGVPWWAGPLLGAATNASLQLIGGALQNLLRADVPAGSFTLQAPCDFDAEGEPLTQTWIYEKQKADERMLAHQITILEALQTHLNWKTPTCGSSSEKPPLEGQWVTTRWKSTEKMAHSGRRLRKLFRYRTKSSRDLGQLSAYWAEFSWQSGDVCVIHKGAWWGTPQVWAESEAEGQRVIRFAAAEAGIDPDQVGEWTISSSRSPRYGMSGTMTIELYEGVPWISSRESASFPNVLALNQDP